MATNSRRIPTNLTRMAAVFVAIGFALVGIRGISATEITSDSFKILDPVIEGSGQISTSTSYQLVGSFGGNALGLSTATSFTINAGFITYPEATAPVLSATAGNSQANLSWTASQGVLGWTISGYDICYGTVTNTYTTCSDVGNVLSGSATGLANGTQYFFRIRAKDAFDNIVARSNETTATPAASSGGGGGVSPPPPSPTSAVRDVIMSGRAYPGAVISLFQNGAVVRTVSALGNGTFSGTINNVSAGTYNFGVQAKDYNGRISVLLTYTVNVPAVSTVVTIENIFLSPTIALSVNTVTQGASVNVLGSAFPGSTVRVEIPSVLEQTTITQSNGNWSTILLTGNINPGSYTVRAYAQTNGDITEATAPQTLTISSVIQPPSSTFTCQGSDINQDGRINLTDVSILLTFWNSTTFTNACADTNSDGRVDLVDLSILLFNWTG